MASEDSILLNVVASSLGWLCVVSVSDQGSREDHYESCPSPIQVVVQLLSLEPRVCLKRWATPPPPLRESWSRP